MTQERDYGNSTRSKAR